jgi:hypothetical protein
VATPSPAEAAVDDDTVVTLGSTWAIEPQQGVHRVGVPVTLSRPLDHDVSMMVATVADDATAGVDYKQPKKPKRVRIRAGRTTAYTNVAVLGDTVAEAKESVQLQVVATDDPALTAGATGTVTVLDRSTDAGAVDVQIGSIVMDEPAAGKAMAKLPISLTHPLDHDMTVRVETVDDSAVGGADHKVLDKDVRIRAGHAGATLAVPVFADDQAEGDERFSVILSSATGGVTAWGLTRGQVTIRDAIAPSGPVDGTVVPGAVTELVGELAGPDALGSVRLRWSPPSEGGPVDSYRVEQSLPDGTWALVHTGTDTEIEHACGLPAVTCVYRVTAANGAGDGPSATATVHTQDVPKSPIDLKVVVVSGRHVRASWAAGTPDGGAPLVRYRVRITNNLELDGRAKPSATWITSTVAATATTALLTCPGVSYGYSRCLVEVRAENAVGVGPWVGTLVATNNPQPDPKDPGPPPVYPV